MNTFGTVIHRNVNLDEENLQRAVKLLARHKYEDLAALLDTPGFPIDQSTDTSTGTHTLLAFAVEREDVQGVKVLLDKGANPNILEYGSPVITMVDGTMKPQTEILGMLLDANAYFLPDPMYDDALPHEIILHRIREFQDELTSVQDRFAEEQDPKEKEELREYSKDLQTQLSNLRTCIVLMSPYLQKYLKKVSIKSTTSNATMTLKVDTRILGEYFYERVAAIVFGPSSPEFDLVLAKQVIPRDKSLTNVITQEGMMVTVVPKLKTGKGGKRKTRKHRKN
jgi:hypothetical protein